MPAHVTVAPTAVKLVSLTSVRPPPLVAVEAMARRFGLWEKLRQHRCLDPRKDRTRGYGPEVITGQLIYALCSGGGCLSDSEALNDDPLARELFGVEKEVMFGRLPAIAIGRIDESATGHDGMNMGMLLDDLSSGM